MSIFRRTRRPRPTDPDPEYSRLDRLDGLPLRASGGVVATGGTVILDVDDRIRPLDGLDTRLTNVQVLGRDRYSQCDETCTSDCGACKGRRFGPYAVTCTTRYDAEWPDVLAAETPGGDLAAMAAPLPGMARDALGTYAEPVEPDLTAEQIDAIRVAVAEWTPVSYVPARGRHRQSDPLDLILADLRDIEDRLS